MPDSKRGEVHPFPQPDTAEGPESAGKTSLQESEATLNQALSRLEEHPEHYRYIRLSEAIEGAKIDYENAWTAFLHTPQGDHYNKSNQRFQNAKEHYQRTLEKVTPTSHFQDHIAAESLRSNSTQAVAEAEKQAEADPDYRQTPEYQQVNQHHQGILARCRQTWRDIGHTLEGRDHQRAKTLFDKAEREVSLAWSGGGQTLQGQRLIRIMEEIDQLEQEYQKSQQILEQVPAYTEYTQAAEAHRLAVLADREKNPDPEPKQAKIIPIKEPPRADQQPNRQMPAAA